MTKQKSNITREDLLIALATAEAECACASWIESEDARLAIRLAGACDTLQLRNEYGEETDPVLLFIVFSAAMKVLHRLSTREEIAFDDLFEKEPEIEARRKK